MPRMNIRGFYVVVTAFLWNFLLQKDVGILPDHDQIFAYTRKLGSEKLLTVCNFSAQEAEMELPETFAEGTQCLITNMGRTVFDRKIVLNPYEAFVLYKKD